jgi:3'(2'),5'-bisphosphate nucleotidase
MEPGDMTILPAGLNAEALARIAVEAGAVIDRFYREGCAVLHKADQSPVTEADRAAEAIILARLDEIAPGIPVVAEEEAAAGRIPEIGRAFALVDPLDGTKEFVARSGEFTVNIAIIVDGTPVMGVVYAPAIARLWATDEAGAWACDVPPGGDLPEERTPIAARRPPPGGLTVIASKSHGTPETEAHLAGFAIAEKIYVGSSLKFCRVAEGRADLYPRFGRTMEWDTAAGHAIVLGAGGRVETTDSRPLTYGKVERGFDNPNFIVWGANA